jgi:aspartate/methionine/tyrosine aminotransferase
LRMEFTVSQNAVRYAQPAGDPRLVDLLTNLRKPSKGRRVVITGGASLGLTASLSLLCRGAKGMLLPECAYPGFLGIGRVLGIPTFRYQMSAELFSAPSDSSAACLVLNAPHNPTGFTPSALVIAQIVAYCARHRLTIVLDEVYDKLWSAPSPLLAEAESRGVPVIQIGNLSKQMALAGVRVGYVIAQEETATEISRNHFALAMSASTLGQDLAVELLKRENAFAWTDGVDEILRRRRGLAREAFEMISPDDGEKTPFFWFAATQDATATALFVEYAARAGVLIAPGSPFFARDDRHVRLNLAACEQHLFQEGLDRLVRLRAAMTKRKRV